MPSMRSLALGSDAIAVAAGAAVAGLTTYGMLIIAARAMNADQYGEFSTFWSLAVIVGLGFFLPIEQETVRAIAPVRQRPGRPSLIRSMSIVASLAVVAVLAGCVLLLVAAPSADAILSPLLAAALVATAVASALQFMTRGLVSGQHRPKIYASILSIEGLMRLAGAGVLLAAGANAPMFGALVATAAAVSVLPAIPMLVKTRSRDLPDIGPRRFSSAVLRIAAGAFAVQAIINGPVLVARVVPDGGPLLAGQILAALTLARIPIFVYQAGQVLYLPRLARAYAIKDLKNLRLTVSVAAGLATIAGVGMTAGVALFGRDVIQLLFGASMTIDSSILITLSGGCAVFLVALVLSDACIALERHTVIPFTWAGSLLATATAAVLIEDAVWRSTLPLVIGASFAVAVFAIVIMRVLRRSAGTPVETRYTGA